MAVKPLPKVPAKAEPVAEVIRSWDQIRLRFFAVKRWHRSHDRLVDGTVYYVPVAAVDSNEIVWTGARFPDQEQAERAAVAAAESIG